MTNSKSEATFHAPEVNHNWPENMEHLYDNWTLNTPREGTTPPTQSRRCIHPKCKHFETRIAP